MVKSNNKIGYLKDKFASVLFIVIWIIIYFTKDLNKIRNLMLIGIVLAFSIDFSFTINPQYHFVTIGYNIPTFLVFFGTILTLFLFFLYRNEINF